MSGGRLTGRYPHARNCDLVDAEVARFVTAIRGADPATPVPTCGRWKLVDLIHHTSHVHRWAAGMVAEYSLTRHSRRKRDLPMPDDPADYAFWLGEAQTLLLPVLRAADPDRPMWTWGADRHARFWARRMVHETAVHRADAELALGRRPTIDPDVAVDGVDELLGLLPGARHFRPEVRSLQGQGDRLRLVATDRPDVWTITLTDRGYEWAVDTADARATPHGAGTREVRVRARAAELYLLLWRRQPVREPRFEITGDADLLAFWLRNAI
jgi:uncharacterized protein (TIGR03083 family)